jgi:hypothetical protein
VESALGGGRWPEAAAGRSVLFLLFETLSGAREGDVVSTKGLVRAEFEGRGDKECESSRTTRRKC